MLRVLLVAGALALSGCGTYQTVAAVDTSTGLLPTTVQATVIKSEKMDLDTRKELLVFPGDSDFVINQIKEIGYFDTVLDKEALEAAIIKADLVSEVPTVEGLLGLNNASKKYKPFLFIDFESRTQGTNQYLQLVLTDAVTMEEVFRSERYLDYVWEGVNDRNAYYPLFNSLIVYIKENSATYKTPAAAAPAPQP